MKNRIVDKIEYYGNTFDGFELQSTLNYTYSYNTVTDEDIVKFNMDNYQEYKYIEY